MQQIRTKTFLLRKSSERFSAGLKKIVIFSEYVQNQIFREINDLYEYVDYFKSGCCIGSHLALLECLKVAIRSISDFQNNK